LDYERRLTLSVFLLVGVLLVSLLIGRYPVSFFDRSDKVGRNIFWNIRLPRVIMAAVLGMALSASGASLRTQVKVLKVIRELSASGRTVLFSTHDPNEASMVADMVVVLDEGRMLDIGVPGDVITKDILQTIYKTDVNLVEVDGKPVVDLSTNFRNNR
jgi:hypothetical protein